MPVTVLTVRPSGQTLAAAQSNANMPLSSALAVSAALI
jgi:hypothetical protein